MLKWNNIGDKATSAENQQERPLVSLTESSETTRQAPLTMEATKAYLLGALHDGTFSSNHRFRISQKGTEWLEFLRKLFHRLGYNGWIYREGSDRDIYVLETLADFLDFRFNPLQLKTAEEKAYYIRGFFDAEGGIPKDDKARFYIQLVQKDKEKLEKLKCLLEDLDINTGKIHNPSKAVDPNYWRMYVKADSYKRFAREINSWHPRKIKIFKKRLMI